MKPFEEIWTSGIQARLEALEAERRVVQAKCLKTGSVCVAIVVAVAAANALFLEAHPAVPIIAFVVAAIGGALFVSGDIRGFKQAFKHEVVREVVAAISPGLDYHPERKIDAHTYHTSLLFLKDPDRYRGEDYVEGTLGATAIRFSELHTEYKTRRTDGKGRTKTQWHTIFRGVFFVADFNKHFAHTTVVLPDRAEAMLGGLGRMFQSLSLRRGDLVTLEDPEFERHFVVYSEDETEARYLLTPAMMRRLVEFRRKTRGLHVSFVGSHVHVAVSMRKDLFEPHLFQSVVSRDLIRDYYDDVCFFTEIVEDLELNTRIWTKV